MAVINSAVDVNADQSSHRSIIYVLKKCNRAARDDGCIKLGRRVWSSIAKENSHQVAKLYQYSRAEMVS